MAQAQPAANANAAGVHVALATMARAARTLPLESVEAFVDEAGKRSKSVLEALKPDERAELVMAVKVGEAFVTFRKAVDEALGS
jgi:predicted LPLAT superfamily acyltransferase